MKTALSIAGSDCSGGAGVQADIKTMSANGVYAMTAITALTAQNTLGVAEVCESSPIFLKKQLDMIFDDIFPDAVKIGMVSSKDLVCTIADRLKFYKAKNIVVDPVMVATSGSRLIKTDAVKSLTAELFPISTVVTPNIPEAEAITERNISTVDDMEAAAKYIGELYGCAVLIKGGHSFQNADDLLYEKGRFLWLRGERINTKNTHGTGCTLSSAIAANLAKGCSLELAAVKAKNYVTQALSAGLDLGKGSGPIDHLFRLGQFCTQNK